MRTEGNNLHDQRTKTKREKPDGAVKKGDEKEKVSVVDDGYGDGDVNVSVCQSKNAISIDESVSVCVGVEGESESEWFDESADESESDSAEEEWNVLSCGSDGTLRLWNPSTSECIRTSVLPPPSRSLSSSSYSPRSFLQDSVSSSSPPSSSSISFLHPAVVSLVHLDSYRVFVLDQSRVIRLYSPATDEVLMEYNADQTTETETETETERNTRFDSSNNPAAPDDDYTSPSSNRSVSSFSSDPPMVRVDSVCVSSRRRDFRRGDFVSMSVSPHQFHLYAVSDEGIMHCFEVKTGKLVSRWKVQKSKGVQMSGVSDTDVASIDCHRIRNVMATANRDGTIKLWKNE